MKTITIEKLDFIFLPCNSSQVLRQEGTAELPVARLDMIEVSLLHLFSVV